MKKTLLNIIIASTIILPTIAWAESGTFTTSPSYSTDHSSWIVRDVNPAGQYEEYITLQNLTEKNLKLDINIIESTGDKNNIKLLENTPPINAGLWIKPETNSVQLKPKEQKQIKLSISVPADIIPGEYQAVALVSEDKADNNQIKIQTRIGTRLYLNVTHSNDLKTNTFTPDNHYLQIGLITLSFCGLLYGLMPSKKSQQKKQ